MLWAAAPSKQMDRTWPIKDKKRLFDIVWFFHSGSIYATQKVVLQKNSTAFSRNPEL